MLSLINIHHFLMDGAIWKLRDGKLARLLIGAPVATREAPAPARKAQGKAKGAAAREEIASTATENGWRGLAWALAGAAALALAGTDLYYRLGIARANEVSRSGDSASAVALYSSVWNLNGRSAEALDGLAFWDLRAGKVAEAAERWERSAALNPTETSAYAHIGLGEAYLRLGRVDEAAEHLEKAMEMKPNEPSSYMLMANVYQHRGDLAKAEEMRARAGAATPQASAPRTFY
jgi:Flp pilus assembly protein TadD